MTFAGVLELPKSEGQRIIRKYVSEEERKSAGVLFWVNNHSYASWRLLMTALDHKKEHSVASKIYIHAERMAGMLSSTFHNVM